MLTDSVGFVKYILLICWKEVKKWQKVFVSVYIFPFKWRYVPSKELLPNQFWPVLAYILQHFPWYGIVKIPFQ